MTKTQLNPMIDSKLTDWIYYKNKYIGSFSRTQINDPVYVAMLPDISRFRNYVRTCPLDELITLIIRLFLNKFPINFSRVVVQLQWNNETETIDRNIVYRELNDMERIEKIYSGESIVDMLQFVKIIFKEEQKEASQWIKDVLEDKDFSITKESGIDVFKLSSPEELIKQISVGPKDILMELNHELIDILDFF